MQTSHPNNLVRHYLGMVAAFSDAPAVLAPDTTVTHGQLAEVILAIALGLHDRGIGPGATIAIRTRDPVNAIASLMAAGLAGARWVFAHANLVGTDRLAIDLVLDDGTMSAPVTYPVVRLDSSWLAPRPVAPGTPLPLHGFRGPGDIWVISQTSGTTGTPKLVGLPYQVMVDRITANSRRIDWRRLRMASLFPVSAPVWLTYAVTALLHAGSLRIGADMDNWFGDGVGFALASPAQARTALADFQPKGRVAILQLSGGPAGEPLIRSLLAGFDSVWVGYGSTEGFNALSTAKSLGPDGRLLSRTILAPGSRVEVVDSAGQPVPVGQEGEVRVTNPYLAPGYMNAPEATAASFRDGWFHPGDLGFWDDQGNFHVTGRVNDQFNLGGHKINAQLLDFTLLGVPGVRDAISFMLPDADEGEGLRAFLSLEQGADQTEVLSNARLALMALGGIHSVPKRFLFADALPRNANGKADRRACVQMVIEGKFRRQARASGRPDGAAV